MLKKHLFKKTSKKIRIGPSHPGRPPATDPYYFLAFARHKACRVTLWPCTAKGLSSQKNKKAKSKSFSSLPGGNQVDGLPAGYKSYSGVPVVYFDYSGMSVVGFYYSGISVPGI